MEKANPSHHPLALDGRRLTGRRRATLILAALACLAACGGGSSGGPLTIDMGRFEDQTLFSDGSTNATFLGLNAGETSANIGIRAGVSFDILGFSTAFLLGVPANATITKATLRLTQVAVIGTPFATLGEVVVDHVDFGLELDAGDYQPSIRAASIGTLTSDADITVRELDVTSYVAADLAAQRRSNFLLRFTGSSAVAIQESVQFEDARLVIEYVE